MDEQTKEGIRAFLVSYASKQRNVSLDSVQEIKIVVTLLLEDQCKENAPLGICGGFLGYQKEPKHLRI
jgi:hypothetical protein